MTTLQTSTPPVVRKPPVMRRRKVPLTRRIRVILVIAVLFAAAFLWFSPLLLLIFTGIRTSADFLAHGALELPREFTFDNFARAWDVGNFAATYRNSAIITLIKVPLGVIITAMLAFALAMLRIRFRRTIMFTVFLGLTIPVYITILPLFILVRQAGLADNVLGLVGPYLAFGIPFEVLVLQSFFQRVPKEIYEAARIDGAGNFRIFFQIVLPLSMPALVTVGILDAVATWNEFLMALVLLSSDENKTIPLGLLNFFGQFSRDSTGLAAGILIAIVPMLIAYSLLQRYIVSGLTMGAVKG